MAGYIGNQPLQNFNSGSNVDVFTPDGIKDVFVFEFDKPGLRATDTLVVVNNVVQRPDSSYTLIDLLQLNLINLNGGVFQVGDIITSGIKTAEVVRADGMSLIVRSISGVIQSGDLIELGIVNAEVQSTQNKPSRGLQFFGTLQVEDTLYVITNNIPTLNSVPPDGTVTSEKIASSLKTTTVDKFVATLGQTDFVLSKTPLNADSILVFIDGLYKTGGEDYLVGGAIVTLTTPATGGELIRVVHNIFAD